MICPQCSSDQIAHYLQDKERSYQKCHFCTLIFVPRNELITESQEKIRYDSHENSTEDSGYRQYLQRIVDQILPEIPEVGSGLDFGCGKTQLLAQLFSEQNYSMDAYDLFFYPDETIWSKSYDFIVLSEVIEHLRDPRKEMSKLSKLLNEKGHIFIKTKCYPENLEEFKTWFYKRDQTHVQFYSMGSLSQMAQELEMQGPQYLGNDLYLLRK